MRGCSVVRIFAVLALVAGIAGLSRADDPVRIGYVGGLTGACAGLTPSAVKAMKMALADINASGGAAGRRLEVIWRDSRTDPDEGARQARDLIVKEKVDLLTGVCSSAVFMAINPIAAEHGVPLISAISGTHRATIDYGHPYVFQTQPHTLMEGRALAEYVARQDWNRVVTIGLDYEWGRTTVAVFTEALARLKPDAEIVGQFWPPVGDSDLTAIIEAVLDANPDLIVAVMFGSGSNELIKQGKSFGLLDRSELLTFLSTETYIALGPEVPDGVHGWARGPFYALDSDPGRMFVDRYRAQHDGEYPNDWGVLAFDAMNIIRAGIDRAQGTDPVEFRRALGSMTFDTLRGPLKMRLIDNTFNAPTYLGVTRKSDTYPFPTMHDIAVIPGDITLPSEQLVAARRAAAKSQIRD